MKTGDGEMDTTAFEKTATDLFIPVLESATVLAAHYAKACDRDVVMSEDMHYGLMYAARNVLGKQIGTLFPEIYDEESDEDSVETIDDDEEMVWARYTGTENDVALKMNECADTWSSWAPDSFAERALKNAVDKTSLSGRSE